MPKTLAEHPVLTPPPNPASPPEPSVGDRELALIWIMGGKTSADTAAYFAYVASVAEGLSAEDADRRARLVSAMAELEAQGFTQESARAALGLSGPVAA